MRTKQHSHYGIRLSAGVIALSIALAALAAHPKPAAAVDAERGREVFGKRCTGCHSLDNDKQGPRLGGVYGRAAGGVATFPYSDAVKSTHVTWDAASLDKWLTDPAAFIPDSNMAFRLVNGDERAAVIAYLKQTSGK